MNLKNGKVFTSKSVGTGPSSYEKIIYRAAFSQRSRNIALGVILCSGVKRARHSKALLSKRQYPITPLNAVNFQMSEEAFKLLFFLCGFRS